MIQPPTSASTSQTPAIAPSSPNIEGILDAALKSYKKKTKTDVRKHDLFKQLDKCDSPAAILAAFQADQFDPSRTGGNDRLKKWLLPAVNVLYAFSATLGTGVGLVNIDLSTLCQYSHSDVDSAGILTRTSSFRRSRNPPLGEWLGLSPREGFLISNVLRQLKMSLPAKTSSSTSSAVSKVSSHG